MTSGRPISSGKPLNPILTIKLSPFYIVIVEFGFKNLNLSRLSVIRFRFLSPCPRARKCLWSLFIAHTNGRVTTFPIKSLIFLYNPIVETDFITI